MSMCRRRVIRAVTVLCPIDLVTKRRAKTPPVTHAHCEAYSIVELASNTVKYAHSKRRLLAT